MPLPLWQVRHQLHVLHLGRRRGGVCFQVLPQDALTWAVGVAAPPVGPLAWPKHDAAALGPLARALVDAPPIWAIARPAPKATKPEAALAALAADRRRRRRADTADAAHAADWR